MYDSCDSTTLLPWAISLRDMCGRGGERGRRSARLPGCETAEMANGGSFFRDDMIFLMLFEAEMMSRE